MIRCLLVAVVAIAACGDKQPPQGPVQNQAEAPTCATQTAELKTWIAAVLDPAQNVAAPWLPGDPDFGPDFDSWRVQMREAMRPADPSKPAGPLHGAPKRGRFDDELASCPPATAQLEAVGGADDKAAAWQRLADAIGACDCKTNIAFVKAWLYVVHRGPD